MTVFVIEVDKGITLIQLNVKLFIIILLLNEKLRNKEVFVLCSMHNVNISYHSWLSLKASNCQHELHEARLSHIHQKLSNKK